MEAHELVHKSQQGKLPGLCRAGVIADVDLNWRMHRPDCVEIGDSSGVPPLIEAVSLGNLLHSSHWLDPKRMFRRTESLEQRTHRWFWN